MVQTIMATTSTRVATTSTKETVTSTKETATLIKETATLIKEIVFVVVCHSMTNAATHLADTSRSLTLLERV